MSAREAELKAALQEAYRFISQPRQMSKLKGGSPTATYDVREYNALTSRIRKALAQ